MSTIRQVAKVCGVSPMTVSFVLNNREGQISEETRQRVLKAMRDLNYRPTARRIKGMRQICTLGVVAGVAGDSLIQPGYHAFIVDGILCAAPSELRHNVTLFTNSIFHADTQSRLRTYCDGRCEGLFVLAPNVGSDIVGALHERGFPFVLIGSPGDDATVSCVDLDNVAEGQKVTEYLVERGHRRIAFVGGPDFVLSAVHRLEGYRHAMASHGLNPDPLAGEPIVYEKELDDLIGMLMRRPTPERPTALFCWNDGAALHVLSVLHALNLRVPQDVSVIGIDDVPMTVTSDPPLTTYRQPYYEISRIAVSALLEQIREGAGNPRREFLASEIVERDSVAAPAPIQQSPRQTRVQSPKGI